mmetsp:Transcript_39140/g.110852  ORF Transcript_39140/g.110852 Transcript_39140/m.110852 type:complete len:548 (-) Transcript_39140:360-2003(-)|eukprot:CAMPEP_0117666750 /NCGR_PEP_ID=MMETSP0804-20121206/10556_1 /TAXON_ID=1074897 /ORGANISM="Tetraselmis astigmatica, Strain CCMP880" /LENGTH=547 /DNA_ID=CAMNT_0005474343 /DNA_START=391 /DNA_END=2034 /DNA_ORIENTATION=-
MSGLFCSPGATAENCFVCLCPPKGIEIDEDGKAHRTNTEQTLQAELEITMNPSSPSSAASAESGSPAVSYLHLPGGGAAVRGNQTVFGSEGSVFAVLMGTLDNYAYLLKKFCSDDADCKGVAWRGLNEIKAAAPISPAVLLCRLFALLGKGMVAKLRGQFALVCFDAKLVRVLAARDPSGAFDLVHGRCPSGTLVVASGAPCLAPGACVSAVPPGYLKYGWYSKPQRYANELEAVKREANEATSAVLKALSGIRKTTKKPFAKSVAKAATTQARVVPPLTSKATTQALLSAQEFIPSATVKPAISLNTEDPVVPLQLSAAAVEPSDNITRPPSPDTLGSVPKRVLDTLAGPLANSEQSKLLSSMLDTSPCAMVITDARKPDNPIVYANRVFELRTGYSQEEVLGRNCRFLQAPPSQPRVPSFASMSLKRNIQTGARKSLRILNYRKDGTEMWNDLSVVPLRDSAGEVTHFIGLQTFKMVGVQQAEEEAGHAVVHNTPSMPAQPISKLKVSFNRSSSCNSLSQLGSLASKSQSYSNLASLATAPGLAC